MLTEYTKVFSGFGVLPENINLFDVEKREKPDLTEIDVLLVMGGNVYYYLKQFRENGYVNDIRGFIERDGVYAGSSAGSTIMSRVVDENLRARAAS